MRSRSNPTSTMRRNHRENEQTRRVPGQIQRRRRAHRHPHRKSRPAVSMSSKLQKRARQRRRSRRNSQRYNIPQLYRREKMCRASAQMICALGQNSRRAYRHPRRRNRGGARMCGRQRNPAQRKRLRGIIFIQGCRKFGLRTICRRAQHRQFVKSRKHRKSAVRHNLKPYLHPHPPFVM